MVAPVRLRLHAMRPIWAAVGVGALVAVAMLLLPETWLKAAARSVGASALLPNDIGLILRVGAALGCGGLAAVTAWAALRLLFRNRRILPSNAGLPALRRADAHPDAPARRPLSAAELAIPMIDPDARPLPDDLDTPLAAVDPTAIPAQPRVPVRALAALAPGERLQTFRLAPPPAREPVAADTPGIDALLHRLEGRGVGRSPA